MKNKKLSLILLSLLTLTITACQPNLALFGLSNFDNEEDEDIDVGGDEEEENEPSTPEKREYIYKGESVLDHLGSDTGSITFQTGGSSAEAKLWKTLRDGFKADNPNITVDFVDIDSVSSITNTITAGNAPDVIQVQSDKFGAWAQKGWLQSIQPFINGEVEGIEPLNTDEYYPQTMQMFKLNTETGVRGNGDIFGLPKDYGVIGIFVNRKKVKERKDDGAFNTKNLDDSSVLSGYADGENDYKKLVSQSQLTFDEYFRIAHHMTIRCRVDSNGVHHHNGYWPDGSFGSNRIHWESMLWGYGSDILTDDYKLNLDDEIVQYVFDKCRDQVTEGSYDFSSKFSDSGTTDSGTAFVGRKIIMYMGGRWNASTFDKSFEITDKNNENGYFCIPVPVAKVKSDGEPVRKPVASSSTVCYAISKNCKNTKMAYKLIKYLASRDGYRTMNSTNYAVPGIKDLKNEDKFKDPMKYNSPYDGGYGNKISNLDAKSAATFFEMAENARVSNPCRFTTDNWITTFETGLNSYLQDTNRVKYKTSYDFLKSINKSVNSAIKKSDPQLFW